MGQKRIDYCPACESTDLDDGYCHECGTDWSDADQALEAADSLRQALNASLPC